MRGSGEDATCLPASVAPGVPGLLAASLQALPPAPQGLFLQLVSLCLLLYGHLPLDAGPTLNPGRAHLEILHLIISAKTLFPNKAMCTGSRAQMYLLGTTNQPTVWGVGELSRRSRDQSL